MAHVIVPEKLASRVKPPAMYALVFINDEYTTYEFVVDALCRFCGKTEEQAQALTWEVHSKGHANAGIYPLELAEMRQVSIIEAARNEGHPLQVVLRGIRD